MFENASRHLKDGNQEANCQGCRLSQVGWFAFTRRALPVIRADNISGHSADPQLMTPTRDVQQDLPGDQPSRGSYPEAADLVVGLPPPHQCVPVCAGRAVCTYSVGNEQKPRSWQRRMIPRGTARCSGARRSPARGVHVDNQTARKPHPSPKVETPSAETNGETSENRTLVGGWVHHVERVVVRPSQQGIQKAGCCFIGRGSSVHCPGL